MSYIFSDLKTKLQNQVGDANLNDTLAGDAINDAQQAIFNKYDTVLNSDQQSNSVTSGTNTLASALPTDFQRVYSLYITSPLVTATDLTPYYLQPKTFRKEFPNAGQFSGVLQEWTLFESVEFAVNAADTYTIKLDYIKSVPILSSSSDVPVIPEAFRELLLVGAKIRIYENKEDFDYSNQFQNRYDELLRDFITRYGMRQVDNQVVVPGARFRVGRR